MAADAPPPTGVIPRFAVLIEAMKRELVVGADRRRLLGPLGKLGPLAALLWDYLMHTRRRLTALHARFAAGSCPPRRAGASPRPRPPTGREQRAGRRAFRAGRCSCSMAWLVSSARCVS
jgi:hypothetical protein